MENIYPIFDSLVQKEEKENLLKQKGMVLWLTGLSGSGKSTIARSGERNLHQEGFLTQLLDGDNLRTGINNNLGFSELERLENIRRTAEVAKLFNNCGLITICSFISPTNDLRRLARNIIGNDFYLVYIDCPVEVCEKRDVKGLYAKARKGEIPNFTGISAPFDLPERPDLVLDSAGQDLQTCQHHLIDFIKEKLK